MKKILFRADGNSEMGLGHLYRIFALYEMLRNSVDCVLLTRSNSAVGVIPAAYNYSLITNDITIEQEPAWLLANFKPQQYSIIADGYQFLPSYQAALKKAGYHLTYIDDLALEHMYADIVVNHSPGVSAQDYDKENYTRLALGTKHAILRPSFLNAAANKREIKTVDTAFVCFGGADKGDLTYRATQALLKLDEIKKINVVIGAAYKHISVEQLSATTDRIKIHRSLGEVEMLKVMQESNFAIAPASNILYELCAVKMPVLSGYYVENQKNIYKGCADNGSVYPGGDFNTYTVSDFEEKIRTIISKSGFETYTDAQAKLFDRNIRTRFLDLFLPVTYRRAVLADVLLLFEWSNEKQTRANSYATEPIPLETHKAWFEKKLADPNALIFIAEFDNEPAGMVRYDLKADETVVGVIVSERFRGRGLAPLFLRHTAQRYFKLSGVPISAYIKKSNLASVKSFESAGYVFNREQNVQGAESFVYQLNLNQI